MDYKLAKELKDAGFPQGDCTCEATESNPEAVCKEMRSGMRCNPPTLSELIEACGESFLKLVKIQLTEGEGVSYFESVSTYKEKGFGSTPEEAVARLWLALNKNNGNKENHTETKESS